MTQKHLSPDKPGVGSDEHIATQPDVFAEEIFPTEGFSQSEIEEVDRLLLANPDVQLVLRGMRVPQSALPDIPGHSDPAV